MLGMNADSTITNDRVRGKTILRQQHQVRDSSVDQNNGVVDHLLNCLLTSSAKAAIACAFRGGGEGGRVDDETDQVDVADKSATACAT